MSESRASQRHVLHPVVRSGQLWCCQDSLFWKSFFAWQVTALVGKKMDGWAAEIAGICEVVQARMSCFSISPKSQAMILGTRNKCPWALQRVIARWTVAIGTFRFVTMCLILESLLHTAELPSKLAEYYLRQYMISLCMDRVRERLHVLTELSWEVAARLTMLASNFQCPEGASEQPCLGVLKRSSPLPISEASMTTLIHQV